MLDDQGTWEMQTVEDLGKNKHSITKGRKEAIQWEKSALSLLNTDGGVCRDPDAELLWDSRRLAVEGTTPSRTS